MQQERQVLRGLAKIYQQLSMEGHNADARKLHTASNDLKMIRPVVLIDELPWHEMNQNDELTLRCQDSYLRELEWFLRTAIYKYRHLRADMILKPYLPVQKVVHSTGIGISIKEETLATDSQNNIVAHDYEDQLQEEESLERLHNPVITYDREETMRRYQLAGELVGDILPVKIVGADYYGVVTWDDISMYRGVTNLLIDLVERPEYTHRMVEKLTQIALSRLEQYEQLGLFEPDPGLLHCTPILTSSLPQGDYDGSRPLTRKDIWGRGAAQIFATVSKAMHEEFDIEYMKRTVGSCGLVYYGCCEPLDKKIDIVEKIPNLRKISITPWADVNVGAEAIGSRYVMSCKPNPAAVGVPELDIDALKKEIHTILDAAKRYHCNVELVLKDISTCCGRPENIFKWEETVMELVRQF